MKLGASADLDWSHIENKSGRIAGGKYLEEYDENYDTSPEGRAYPLTRVEADIRPTHTESIMKDGKEWQVLTFESSDPEDPFNWPLSRKVFMTALLCLMTLFIGLATTAYQSGMARMVKHFGVSNEMGELGLFLFNITCAIAPLILAPFAELVGRYVIYAGAYILFCLCFIGLALGRNIATILVMRAFLGLFGCVGTILVGGTFDDMFRPHERTVPMATFAWVAILGTVCAPIYAGFIDQAIGWRWVQGIQGLSNIPLLIVIILFFKETRGGAVLAKRARNLRNDTGDDRWVSKEELEAPGLKDQLYASSVKAFRMLVTEPVVLSFGLWISFAWFLTFLFLSVIGITFSEKKHWGEGVAGLPYIGLGIGCTLGFASNFLQIRKYNQVRAELNGRPVPPEARLYGAMIGSVFLPIGLFIYSFTQYAFVHWIGPCIALTCIGIGIYYILECVYSYTADCYGPSASSAIAGQGFMRNTLGAVSPLFGLQFFHNLGSQWAGLLLSLIACLLTTLPFIMFKFGPAIRARSSNAIRYDDDDSGDSKSLSQEKGYSSTTSGNVSPSSGSIKEDKTEIQNEHHEENM
uniref:Fructose facilitator n=1 Tax=Wickerhamiella domercqiae TaxID=45788 RepID=A0A0N7IS32_WICDO|nr:fructose facilitator [Wickerhamiella domercqiae]